MRSDETNVPYSHSAVPKLEVENPRDFTDKTRLNYQAVRAGWDIEVYGAILGSDPINDLLPWQQRHLIQMQNRNGRSGSMTHAMKTMQVGIGMEEIERALDDLSARGVPLDDMSMVTNLADITGLHEVTGEITKLGLLDRAAERHSAGHAFAQDWIVRFCEIYIQSPVQYARYVENPALVAKLFSDYAVEWAERWKNERPMPSKACIAYCRRRIDGTWKNRAYGESVTSLFLNRFAMEIAWARRARYHFGVDGLASIGITTERSGYGYQLEDEMSALFKKASRTVTAVRDRHRLYPNPAVAFDPITAEAMSLALDGAEASWRVPENPSKRISAYGLTADLLKIMLADNSRSPEGMQKMRSCLESSFSSGGLVQPQGLDASARKMWAAVPGILASVFLDHAAINPDHTFIFMLLAFIESEAGRTNVPLLPKSHSAYKVPHRRDVPFENRFAARLRSIEARRKCSVEPLDNYARFGWFHVAVCRMIPTRDLDTLQESEIMPQLSAQAGMSYEDRHKRRMAFPPLLRRKRLREKEDRIQRQTSALELSGRYALLHRDGEARSMACIGWGRAILSSPTIKASRFAFANKYKPVADRLKYLRGLSSPDAIFRGIGRSDYSGIYSGDVMPELMAMMVRKTKNEFRCGLARYGFAGVDESMADRIAVEDICQKLVCLSSAAPQSLFWIALNHSTHSRNYPGHSRYNDQARKILARDPLLIQARCDQRTEFDVRPGQRPSPAQRRTGMSPDPVEQVRMYSFRRMMKECRRILIWEKSDYPFIKGAKDFRVFAAWKQDVETYQRVTSRNFVLSYLDYVIRHAAWSGVAWDVMSGTSRRENPPVSKEDVIDLLR